MLPPRVLKMSAEQLVTPLTTIFNLALEEIIGLTHGREGSGSRSLKRGPPRKS